MSLSQKKDGGEWVKAEKRAYVNSLVLFEEQFESYRRCELPEVITFVNFL